MAKTSIDRIGFRQGVKATLDPSTVPPDALWEARNVRADDSGILRIRRGVVPFNAPLGKGAMQGARSALGRIFAAWSRNLYKFSSEGTPTLFESTIGLIGVKSDDDIDFLNWAHGGSEVLYVITGNGLWETDGDTAARITPHKPGTGERPNLLKASDDSQDLSSGPAKSRFGIIRASIGQRAALSGNPGAPNEVYLSEVLNMTYFPDDQVIRLPDDGGRITGLTNWYGALVIFRDKDIWAFFGADVNAEEKALVLQVSSVGCLNPRAIADVPGAGIAFVGHDNIYGLQGVSGIEREAVAVPLSDDVKKYLTKESKGVSSVYYDREYRLSLPASAIPECVLRLSLQHATGWYVDAGPRTVQFFTHENDLYGLDASEGLIHKFTDALLDAGKVIRFYTAFRRETLQPGPSRIKRLYIYAIRKGRRATVNLACYGPVYNEDDYLQEADIVLGTSQNLDIRLVVDGKEFMVKDYHITVKHLGSLILAGHEPVTIYEARFHPSLLGHFAQVRVSANEPGEDIAILGYSIEYSPRKASKGERVVV